MVKKAKAQVRKRIRHKDEIYDLLTEVAAKLKVTASKIQNGIRTGHVRSVKENGRLYVVVASVENFLVISAKYCPGNGGTYKRPTGFQSYNFIQPFRRNNQHPNYDDIFN